MVPLACGRDPGGEEEWGRHKDGEKERMSVLPPSAERKQPLCPQAGVFMLKRGSKHIGDSSDGAVRSGLEGLIRW